MKLRSMYCLCIGCPGNIHGWNRLSGGFSHGLDTWSTVRIGLGLKSALETSQFIRVRGKTTESVHCTITGLCLRMCHRPSARPVYR